MLNHRRTFVSDWHYHWLTTKATGFKVLKKKIDHVKAELGINVSLLLCLNFISNFAQENPNRWLLWRCIVSVWHFHSISGFLYSVINYFSIY